MIEAEFEDLFVNLFGNGLTEGAVLIENNETGGSESSRDLDILLDFIHLNCADSTVVINAKTSKGEVIAVNSAPSGLEPSFEVFKDDKVVPVWLVSTPKSPENLPDDGAFPVPGLDGWQMRTRSGLDYSVADLTSSGTVLNLDAPIAIAFAKQHTSDHWTNLELTTGEFIAELMDHKEGQKEGNCLLQGRIFEAAKTTRKAAMMLENFIVCLDLDNGTTFKEIDDKMAKTGLAYVRYTTHSHNATLTDVSKKQYAKHFGDDAEVTLQGLRDWLHEEKGYLKSVCATVTGFTFIQKSDGDFYQVEHGPVSKNRVIVFLDTPFQLRGENAVASAPEKWKERYLGFAESTGLLYDRACTDAARLFYFPRHAKGRTDFETKFFDGRPLNLLSHTPIKPAQLRAKAKRNKHSAVVDKSSPASIIADFVGTTGDPLSALYAWGKEHSFEIVEAMKDHCPDMIIDNKAKGGRGSHIICPNEDMHSKTGGSGTYAVSASASEGGDFELFCTHSHCMDLGKFGLLNLMIERGDYFPPEVLEDENYSPSLLIDETPVEVKAPTPQVAEEQPPTPPPEKTKKELKKEAAEENKYNKASDIIRQINEKYAMVQINKETNYIKYVADTTNPKGYNIINKDSMMISIDREFKLQSSEGSESAAQMWLKSPNSVHYDAMRFDPKNTDDTKIFNTFRGFTSLTPKKGDWSNIKSHFLDTICGGNDYHYMVLMTWIAHMIQRPWEKPGFAIVVSGGKGVGKTLFTKILAAMVAPYSKMLVQGDQITGKFNTQLSENILTIANEAFFAGDTNSDSALKTLITETEMEVEGKGVDVKTVSNYTRIIFTSNELWIIRASSSRERRYFCFHIPNIVDEAAHAEKFKALYAEIENGGLEALFYELQNWVPPFENGWNVLHQAPYTDALGEQQKASMDSTEQFFVDILTYGFTNEDSTVEEVKFEENKNNRVDFHVLKAHYTKYVRRNRSGQYKTNAEFFKALNKYLNPIIEETDTQKIVLTPTLKTLRDKFNDENQFKIEKENFVKVELSKKLKLVTA